MKHPVTDSTAVDFVSSREGAFYFDLSRRIDGGDFRILTREVVMAVDISTTVLVPEILHPHSRGGYGVRICAPTIISGYFAS